MRADALVVGVTEKSHMYFHTPSNIARSMLFYILSAGHFNCGPDYFVTREGYGNYLLMYVKSGRGRVTYQEKTSCVKAGDAVLIDCNLPHAYSPADRWEILWFHFAGNVSGQFYELIFERSGCFSSVKNPAEICARIEAVINCCKSGSFFYEPIISCHIHQILTDLYMETNQNTRSPDSSGTVPDAVFFISKNYKNKINIKDLSEYVRLSPYYFCRVFKKETGYSPYEYILMTRLNMAKELLKTTDKPVKAIAFETGFGSESNFITTFKKHTALSPARFRNMQF